MQRNLSLDIAYSFSSTFVGTSQSTFWPNKCTDGYLMNALMGLIEILFWAKRVII